MAKTLAPYSANSPFQFFLHGQEIDATLRHKLNSSSQRLFKKSICFAFSFYLSSKSVYSLRHTFGYDSVRNPNLDFKYNFNRSKATYWTVSQRFVWLDDKAPEPSTSHIAVNNPDPRTLGIEFRGDGNTPNVPIP